MLKLLRVGCNMQRAYDLTRINALFRSISDNELNGLFLGVHKLLK